MEALELFARYVWPMILAWNIFLFKGQQDARKEIQAYKLYVAQNYTSKADLQNMFTDFEKRFNEKLEMFFSLAKKP